jgi:hypothetical protein
MSAAVMDDPTLVESLVIEYAEADKARKQAEATLKQLREQLLKYAGDPPHRVTLTGGDYAINILYTNQGKFGDEAVDYLESRGLSQAIKKTVNPEQVAALIELQFLTHEELVPFWIEKWVPQVRVGAAR